MAELMCIVLLLRTTDVSMFQVPEDAPPSSPAESIKNLCLIYYKLPLYFNVPVERQNPQFPSTNITCLNCHSIQRRGVKNANYSRVGKAIQVQDQNIDMHKSRYTYKMCSNHTLGRFRMIHPVPFRQHK